MQVPSLGPKRRTTVPADSSPMILQTYPPAEHKDGHDPSGGDRRVDTSRDLVGEQSREERGNGSEPRRDHATDVLGGSSRELGGAEWPIPEVL